MWQQNNSGGCANIALMNTSGLGLKFQLSLQVLACANLLVSMSFQVLHLALPTMHRLMPSLHFYLKIVREPRKVRDATIYSSKNVHKGEYNSEC